MQGGFRFDVLVFETTDRFAKKAMRVNANWDNSEIGPNVGRAGRAASLILNGQRRRSLASRTPNCVRQSRRIAAGISPPTLQVDADSDPR